MGIKNNVRKNNSMIYILRDDIYHANYFHPRGFHITITGRNHSSNDNLISGYRFNLVTSGELDPISVIMENN